MRTLLLAAALSLVGCGTPPTPVVDAGQLPVIHDCATADYVDRTAATAERKIGFGTALGSPALGYAPRCLTIAVGQTVTFVGNFNTHPLVGGQYNGDGGSPNNPIPRQEMGSADLPITFATAGSYPFYCDLHAPTMIGVVRVQ